MMNLEVITSPVVRYAMHGLDHYLSIGDYVDLEVTNGIRIIGQIHRIDLFSMVVVTGDLAMSVRIGDIKRIN